VLLFCSATNATAQKRRIVAEEPDTVNFWRGFQVHADAVGAAQLFLSSYGQIECGLRLNFKDKWFPAIEIGVGSADATDDATGITYSTSAPYGKIGIDFNIAKHKHDDYRLYAGFRYAYTKFKFDIGGIDITDPVWKDSTPYGANDIEANYHWIEGLLGVDAKIFGPFRLGWTVRYRRRVSHSEGSMGNCWYVPGYGRQGGTRLGGTFNVAIEF